MIISIGEILADMIGIEENGVVKFSRYAGGAPFNVACDVKKLGGAAGFIGRVGDDLIGKFLCKYAEEKQLDYLYVSTDSLHNTTLAFVELDAAGERKFSFYRKNTADYKLEKACLASAVQKANIVHLGSLMLSEEEGRAFADEVAANAKRAGKLLSFDVNYREDVYASPAEAVSVYKKYVGEADVVKFSEDEILLFAGTDDLNAAIKKMSRKNQLLCVTLGKRGSIGVFNDMTCRAESIPVKAVDTTGAGDAFYAGVLSKLDGKKLSELDERTLGGILSFANVCGALTAGGFGAIDACPDRETVEKILNT